MGINLLFGLILLFWVYQEMELSDYLKIWLLLCPVILLLHLIKIEKGAFVAFRDALLFLLTGGSIGTTIGSLMRNQASLLEIVWLILAIFVAIIHYSPSKRDSYRN